VRVIIKMNYLKYFENGCSLCPRKCMAIRTDKSSRAYCRAGADIIAARASLHLWEEPCLSGNRGSGTIFFSGCQLNCIFCQNSEISHNAKGKSISPERLSEIFFELKEAGAHNINLVSPTPYIPHIIKAVTLAKNQGFGLPIVYNSSGYERAESLQLLDGLIDIYLPDFKYMSAKLAKKYSGAKDYPDVAKVAICEMVKQQPMCVFDKNGMLKKGVIVRHLVLPGCIGDSKEIIKYLYSEYGDKIYFSIMSQYTPHGELSPYPELARKLSIEEYESTVSFAQDTGITQGFIQDGEAAEESFIPAFDFRGI